MVINVIPSWPSSGTHLRNIDGKATDLWTLRYEALLAPRT